MSPLYDLITFCDYSPRSAKWCKTTLIRYKINGCLGWRKLTFTIRKIKQSSHLIQSNQNPIFENFSGLVRVRGKFGQAEFVTTAGSQTQQGHKLEGSFGWTNGSGSGWVRDGLGFRVKEKIVSKILLKIFNLF